MGEISRSSKKGAESTDLNNQEQGDACSTESSPASSMIVISPILTANLITFICNIASHTTDITGVPKRTHIPCNTLLIFRRNSWQNVNFSVYCPAKQTFFIDVFLIHFHTKNKKG